MYCPDTVALWTEFLKEVKRGELKPRFPANRLSRKAKKSRGKKAETQDVELYMSYLFVARAEEPGSDSENDSGSNLRQVIDIWRRKVSTEKKPWAIAANRHVGMWKTIAYRDDYTLREERIAAEYR
ncbi:hypothetical protein ACQRIT_004735 [Beauveria bassiana]